ncbi:neuropeptide-like precursor 1 [Pectinophora gossypiella]|uniref:neuropeptide-like precursor 1 n=1 Tax=Pectinophora gossypiella TaxID=13191 RepID=UPI00214F5E36|nr:neuropeptide-like precursor 1 [Pectinophora gossypiella]
MKGNTARINEGKHRSCFLLIAVVMAFSTYIEQVVSLPADTSNPWPTFSRRNIAALARDGYLKSGPNSFKRSISTLAKNGQLPTFRSPYDETDKQEQDEDESHEKRHIASIARMRSYAVAKRNIQALARDGYRGGRGQYNQQNDKRNIQSLARSGMIHKRDEIGGDEYYYPFYQNPIPPLSEIDGPFDYNELYDLQQSINPDMFPPLSQVYKRSVVDDPLSHDYGNVIENNWYFKRGSMGLPAHGLYRPMYAEPNSRAKRYIMSMPDVIDRNDIHEPENTDNANEDKRSVGSIPLTRISELGNISLVPKLSQQSIQTTPTYRRRQYLLTRTRPDGSSTDR